MRAKTAIRRLFTQFHTEALFGWYIPDPKWRQMMRKLYSVEWVSAHHRNNFPPSLVNEHARRIMAFNAELRKKQAQNAYSQAAKCEGSK